MISPALQSLYDEHETILAMADRVEDILGDMGPEAGAVELASLIDFFQRYGDRYHHGKEEQLLFPKLVRENAALEPLVDSLSDHHQLFRDRLRSAAEAFDAGDAVALETHLRSYVADLRDHISAENDELFVTADEVLTDAAKEEIYYLFIDHDRELGIESKRELENHADRA